MATITILYDADGNPAEFKLVDEGGIALLHDIDEDFVRETLDNLVLGEQCTLKFHDGGEQVWTRDGLLSESVNE